MSIQTHVLSLSPGQDLRQAVEEAFAGVAAAHGCSAACIVAAVGSLSQSVLRYAGAEQGTTRTEPLELVSLSGTISPDGVHLHASVADAQGQVFGGHVLPGCRVRTTVELVIGLLPGWQFSRAVDPATGYRELQVRPVPPMLNT
jgi:predicted DNA-binding protein with PD1-like motif